MTAKRDFLRLTDLTTAELERVLARRALSATSRAAQRCSPARRWP
jgi:hypothetical protein